MKPEKQLSQDELYAFFGPTLEVSFGKYFAQEQIPEAIELYQKINFDLHDSLLKPIPHAFETVSALKEEGYLMAIVSNKRTPAALHGLQIVHLDAYFDIVLGAEKLPEPKPSASGLIEACNLLNTGHDDVIYIGDNATDIRCAKNMAAFSVGFTEDPRQKEAMEKEHPCRVIQDLRELLELCKEERAWSDNTIW